eukprot:782659-Pelagomonas_calceolata.AAC.1
MCSRVPFSGLWAWGGLVWKGRLASLCFQTQRWSQQDFSTSRQATQNVHLRKMRPACGLVSPSTANPSAVHPARRPEKKR